MGFELKSIDEKGPKVRCRASRPPKANNKKPTVDRKTSRSHSLSLDVALKLNEHTKLKNPGCKRYRVDYLLESQRLYQSRAPCPAILNEKPSRIAHLVNTDTNWERISAYKALNNWLFCKSSAGMDVTQVDKTARRQHRCWKRQGTLRVDNGHLSPFQNKVLIDLQISDVFEPYEPSLVVNNDDKSPWPIVKTRFSRTKINCRMLSSQNTLSHHFRTKIHHHYSHNWSCQLFQGFQPASALLFTWNRPWKTSQIAVLSRRKEKVPEMIVAAHFFPSLKNSEHL